MPSSAKPTENPIKGLSSAEAQAILGRVGPNATPDVAVHPLRLVLSKFLAPVSVLLEIAVVLQLVLGEYIEASIIGALLIFNTAIGFFHESRAQSTIAALKSRLALNASILRDGAWTISPATGLVPGDIVKLSLGAVVAADVRIREGSILLDQSMLTGESLPVEAGPGTETYAGALVRRGEAVAEVLATGGAPNSDAPRSSFAPPMSSAPSRRRCSASCAILPPSTAPSPRC